MEVNARWAEGWVSGKVVHVGPTTFTITTGTTVEWHYSKAEALRERGAALRPLGRLLTDGTVGRVGPTLPVSHQLYEYLRGKEPDGPDRYVAPVTRVEMLERVARGWLLFHAGEGWGPDQDDTWRALDLGPECTSKALGDATRKALAMPSPVAT